MLFRECSCVPPVDNPVYRVWISTGGPGIYQPGETIEDALRNAYIHARKDRLRKRDWTGMWIELISTGEVVKDYGQDFPTYKEVMA